MITSTLSARARTTIPRPVRTALDLAQGDRLAYSIHDDRVILTKRPRVAAEDTFATFAEWDGEADRRAYARL